MENFITIKKNPILTVLEGTNTAKTTRSRYLSISGFKFVDTPQFEVTADENSIVFKRCDMNQGITAKGTISIDPWGNTTKGSKYALDEDDSDDDTLYFDRILNN